jgi:hypothetical protein
MLRIMSGRGFVDFFVIFRKLFNVIPICYIVHVFVLAWNISRVDGSTTTTTLSYMDGVGGSTRVELG